MLWWCGYRGRFDLVGLFVVVRLEVCGFGVCFGV